MAVTISTSQDWDSAARAAGEATTIQGGAVLTVNTDTRYHKNAPASGTGTFGAITMTSATGGELLIDGRDVRWLPYTGGSGNAPAYDTDIVGDTSGATGKLLGVYTTVASAPIAVGSPINATGFIKLKSASDSYNASETLTGITASTNGTDVAGWIEIVMDDVTDITIARAQKITVRSEWFYLDNTTGAAQVIQLPTCGGGANTMYPGVWIETGVGTNAYEFYPAQRYSAALASGWYSTAKGTDARSKFVEMQDGGAIRIGANADGAYGFIPPSGCKVRIPNVLMMSAATATRASNSLPHATVASRPEFVVTSAGNIDIQGCLSTWYFNLAQPYSVTIKNTAIVDNFAISECATAFTLEEFHTGNYLNTDVNNATFTSNLAGGTVTKCKWGRTGARASADYGTAISYCKDITLTDCHFQGRIFRTNAGSYVAYAAYSDNIRFIRPVLVGGALVYTVSTNNYVEDPVYADSYHTTSSATTPPVGAIQFISGSVGSVLKGGSFWSGIDNMHPDTAYLYLTNASSTRWYGCGTQSSPITGGSSNAMLYAINDAGSSLNTEIKRVYFTSLGTRFIASVNSSKGLIIEDCSGNYGTNTTNDALDCISKGFAVSAADTAFTSVYGTIFYNLYTAADTGRVGLVFNEETSTYASYVNKTGLTGASGFSSAGTLYLYNSGDTIEYTFPYNIVGYDSFAEANVVVAGSGTANLSVQFDIDVHDGNGYIGWTDATSEELAALSIDATLGFNFKVKITSNTSAANYLNSLYFTMATSQSNQETILYPLDTVDATFSFSGLEVGTEVILLDVNNEEVKREVITGTTFEYDYEWNSNDGDVSGYYALIWKDDKFPIKFTGITLGDESVDVPIAQQDDLVYGTASTNLTVDYENQVINMIDEADYDVQGGYSAWKDGLIADSSVIQYPFAFSIVGGNEIVAGSTSIPFYTFFANGWQLKPNESSYTLNVVGGVLMGSGGEDPIRDTDDPYLIRVNYQQPVQAITVSSSGSGATPAEVWSYSSRTITNKDGFTLSAAGVASVQSGLAPANEYDSELTAIQADLDNPDQYKADVSGLSTFDPSTDEVDVGSVKGTPVVSVDDFKADVSGLATSEQADKIEHKVDDNGALIMSK